MSKPRFYQRRAKDALMFAWAEYRTALLHLATASGKTFIASYCIKELLPSKCLFVCDADELIAQSVQSISRWAGVIPAIEKAERRASLDAQVVVSSIQTLSRNGRIERFPRNHFAAVFQDESHRGSDRLKRVADYFSTAKVCGLTATPWRANVRDLSDYYEVVAYSLPMLDLIQQGFAPPWEVLTLPIEIDLQGVKSKLGSDGKDYDLNEADQRIEPWYEKIAELYADKAKGRHGIAYLPLIKSSERFASICRDKGIRAVHICGESEDRDEILERFRRNDIDLLVNSSLLTTGVDLPNADCFLCLRPTHSIGLFLQMAGRFARPLPGVIDHLTEEDQAEERKIAIAESAKPTALLLDVLYQHDQLGAVHPGHLISQDEEEAKAIYQRSAKLKTPHDLIELANKVLKEREEKLRKALEEAADKAKKKLVPPELVGVLVNHDPLINYHPLSRWEMQPPSEKQVELLVKYGVNGEEVRTMGFASKLLDIILTRVRFHLATLKQLRLLRRMKAEVLHPEKLTLKAAGKVLDSQFKIKAAKHAAERKHN